MRYTLTADDFKVAFDFALKYHLEPKKSSQGRTSGVSRGLGEVLDSFLRGKLVEMGVSKALEILNPSKKCKLDFDIKDASEINDEPDIFKVVESGASRDPKCFIEIKHIAIDDRWAGLHTEQFETIKRKSNIENIFIVGAYIENKQKELNKKQTDLLGIYLKDKFDRAYFSDFGDLDGNIDIVIDYVISGSELENNGISFSKGSLMYETDIFQFAGPLGSKYVKAGNFQSLVRLNNGSELEKYKVTQYPEPQFLGPIKLISGDIEVFEKINDKSTKRFILAYSNSVIENSDLGRFNLEAGKVYFYNLATLGRNPILNRNNVWIAKRAIPYLQEAGKLKSTDENFKTVADNI